jgi:hypothetical protein
VIAAPRSDDTPAAVIAAPRSIGVKERVSAEMPYFPAEIPAVCSLTRFNATETLIRFRGSTP